MIWLVTRHVGANAWATQQGITIDRHVEHLDLAQIQANDTVIGTLPIQMVAELCALSARYWHLVLEVPLALRGVELSAEQMRVCGARLEAFFVERVGL
jgi:CRISPR-associated protein Csx16